MKKLASLLVLLVAIAGQASVTLPYVFTPGSSIKSSELNADFGALRDEVNGHEVASNPHNVTLEQALTQNNSCGGTPINFNNTQALNFRLESPFTDPLPGQAGRLYLRGVPKYDTGSAIKALIDSDSVQALSNKAITDSSFAGDGSGLISLNANNIASGTLPIVRGGTGQATKAAAFDALSPLTTKGDLVVRNGSTNTRLGAGTDGQFLTVDSAQANGVKWTNISAGSVSGTANHAAVFSAGGVLSSEAQLAPSRGGSGVANSGTFTWGSNPITLTTSGATSLTLPTSGTVVTADVSGNFSAGTITASLTGAASLNALKATTITPLTPLSGGGDLSANRTISISKSDLTHDGYLSSADWQRFDAMAGGGISALTGDVTATGPGAAAATVASVGGSLAANIHSAELAANAATSANTVSKIVARDASGNFSAGTITASGLNLSGQTASTVPYLDASKNLVSSSVTPTQLSYLDATSSIQTQLNAKAPLAGPTFTGTLTGATGSFTGNVGIGSTVGYTSSFVDRILTVSNTTASKRAMVEVAGNYTTDTMVGGVSFHNASSTDSAESYRIAQVSGDRDGANNAGALKFWTHDSATTFAERMRINSSGNVGIGTTGAYPFDVATSATGTTVGSNVVASLSSKASGRDAHLRFGDGVNTAARIGYLSGDLYFATNGSERMRINLSNGYVGIGKTGSTALDVNGTVTATAFSGPLTGNVTGNVSGTAANVTGVVATANGGTGVNSTSVFPTSGAVISTNSTSLERMERIAFSGGAGANCTTASCTIDSQSGSWITSVSRSATGTYTLNIAAGVFSTAPVCVCSSVRRGAGSSNFCYSVYQSSSATSVPIYIIDIAGAASDGQAMIHCMGPR